MSVDELAREAAAEARRRATQHIDAGIMLQELHRTRRMRSVASVASVLALVVVLLLGGGLLAQQYDTATPDVVSGRPTSIASTPASPSPACSDDVVTCLGNDRFRVALDTPVTVTVPANFSDDFRLLSSACLEVYRSDSDSAGITVMENPLPVRNDESWTRDARAGDTARSEATWLSRRPFLTNTHLIRTTVGGLRAWRVSGMLKPNAEQLAWKNGQQVAPAFTLGEPKAAYWPGLVAEFTFVDVPNSGVTVIWSWAQNERPGVLAHNQALVDALQFGA